MSIFTRDECRQLQLLLYSKNLPRHRGEDFAIQTLLEELWRNRRLRSWWRDGRRWRGRFRRRRWARGRSRCFSFLLTRREQRGACQDADIFLHNYYVEAQLGSHHESKQGGFSDLL
jgi:hypothetical protein